jgi:hypothetical protein
MSNSNTSEPTQRGPEPSSQSEPESSAASKTHLFDDGGGDYRILIMREDGSLIFPPEVPGFESQRTARLYVKNSGDLFRGMQLAIVRFADLVAVQVQSNPSVELNFKART